MTAFEKLERLLIENGDIGIPVFEFDKWILMDENDSEIAEGKTLEEAATNLYAGE